MIRNSIVYDVAHDRHPRAGVQDKFLFFLSVVFVSLSCYTIDRRQRKAPSSSRVICLSCSAVTDPQQITERTIGEERRVEKRRK